MDENFCKNKNPKFRMGILKQLQSLHLDGKLRYTKNKIDEFYDYYDSEVIICYSGGVNSKVLLHLIRKYHPDIRALYLINEGVPIPKSIDDVKNLEILTVKSSLDNFDPGEIDELQVYTRNNNISLFVGTIADDESYGQQKWLEKGCNIFNRKAPTSMPLSIWTKNDIEEYIKVNNL